MRSVHIASSRIDQHHPVCAAKEREYFIDGAATPPRLRRGIAHS
jgi:hypothetical protein